MELYTEDQMLGYLIMALKNLGYDKKEIREAINKVSEKAEIFTEQYAEEVYEEF